MPEYKPPQPYNGQLNTINDFVKLARCELELASFNKRNVALKQESFPKVREYVGRGDGLLEAADIIEQLLSDNFTSGADEVPEGEDDNLLQEFSEFGASDIEHMIGGESDDDESAY